MPLIFCGMIWPISGLGVRAMPHCGSFALRNEPRRAFGEGLRSRENEVDKIVNVQHVARRKDAGSAGLDGFVDKRALVRTSNSTPAARDSSFSGISPTREDSGRRGNTDWFRESGHAGVDLRHLHALDALVADDVDHRMAQIERDIVSFRLCSMLRGSPLG